MDREKLNKAAETHAKIMGDVPAINSTYAFKRGADWLMQQPLSERLTDEEKEKIINYYNPYCDEPNLYMQGVRAGLTLAFGADLFNPDQPTAI